jgi:hypothetical protein
MLNYPFMLKKGQRKARPSGDFPFCVAEYVQEIEKTEKTGNRGKPYMSLNTENTNRLNSTKLVEAMVIALLTTLLIYLLAIPKLEEKITTLSKEVEGVKLEVREIRSDIYVPAHRAGPNNNNNDEKR